MYQIGSIFDYVQFKSYGNNEKTLYIDKSKIEAIMECVDHSNQKVYTAIYISGCRFPVDHTPSEVFKKIDQCDKTREKAWDEHYKKVNAKSEPVPADPKK